MGEVPWSVTSMPAYKSRSEEEIAVLWSKTLPVSRDIDPVRFAIAAVLSGEQLLLPAQKHELTQVFSFVQLRNHRLFGMLYWAFSRTPLWHHAAVQGVL